MKIDRICRSVIICTLIAYLLNILTFASFAHESSLSVDCGETHGDVEGHLWATHTSNNIIKCSLYGFLKDTGGAITPVLPLKTDLPEEESE